MMADFIRRSDIKWHTIEFEERCHNDVWTVKVPMAYKSEVNSLPAADVRPVVRGEWKPNVPPRDLRPRCSACGELQPRKTNFCPDCGADMRGEQDEKA